MRQTFVHAILQCSEEDIATGEVSLTPQSSVAPWGFKDSKGILCLTGRNSAHYFLERLEASKPDQEIAVVRLLLQAPSFISQRRSLEELPNIENLSITAAKIDLRKEVFSALGSTGVDVENLPYRRYEPFLFRDNSEVDQLHDTKEFRHLKAIAYSIFWEDFPVEVLSLYDTSDIADVEMMGPNIRVTVPNLRIQPTGQQS